MNGNISPAGELAIDTRALYSLEKLIEWKLEAKSDKSKSISPLLAREIN
ncbi:hypothetical protein MICCA_730015 [Microcystis aeruginosa PCC 9432]|uniref:Uncharacterized protein n=1 Tax=Microcystis aeruginosa PCC 9432 TaxID=1160280 RepID=A0A830RB03_MICAE|nr:hypothetical protein MICCA_730015 [Microcystis aeruginosa PCC 9432]